VLTDLLGKAPSPEVDGARILALRFRGKSVYGEILRSLCARRFPAARARGENTQTLRAPPQSVAPLSACGERDVSRELNEPRRFAHAACDAGNAALTGPPD
jgi:hypothetical protein